MTKPYMKAGWTFEVKSWENDGDHRNTKTHTVTDENHARALVDLIKLFESDDEVSNMYEPDDAEITYIGEKAKEWAEKHLAFVRAEYQDESLDLSEWEPEDFAELLSGTAYELGLAGTEFYTRAVDGWKIYYSPEDIFLNDVTKDFK